MKIISLLITLILSTSIYAQTSFERGYKDGYKEGYCYNDFGCIAPIPPLAPIPKSGESKDNYQDGYNRGFKRGLEDKTRDLKKNQSQAASNAQQLNNHQFEGYTGGDMSGTLQALPEIEMPTRPSLSKLREQNLSGAIAIESSYRSFSSYPEKVSNGWHNVTCVSKATNKSFAAKVYVSANKITKLDANESLGDNYKLTFDANVNRGKATQQLTNNYDGSITVIDMYFFEFLNNPYSSAKAPLLKGKISFWTDYKKAVGTRIYVDGEYIGSFIGYFTDGEPSCGQEGTVTYENKAGRYTFEAHSNRKGNWAGTIEIKEGDCSTILLSD